MPTIFTDSLRRGEITMVVIVIQRLCCGLALSSAVEDKAQDSFLCSLCFPMQILGYGQRRMMPVVFSVVAIMLCLSESKRFDMCAL